MTTTTNPLAALPRAEAHLIASVDAATASVGTIATHTLDDALSRFEGAVDAAHARLRMGAARLYQMTHTLLASVNAVAEGISDALDWSGPDELPGPLDPVAALSLPALPDAPPSPAAEASAAVEPIDPMARKDAPVARQGTLDVEAPDVAGADSASPGASGTPSLVDFVEALVERQRLDPTAPPVIVPASMVASAACAPVDRDDRKPQPAPPAQPATVKKPRGGKRKGVK